MEASKTIHLEQPNTLSKHLSLFEKHNLYSLKISGLIGKTDVEDVLEEMCELRGYYDDDDEFIADYEQTPYLRHLDLGEAKYTEGNSLPYFGLKTLLVSFIMPQGITTTVEDDEENIFTDSEYLEKLVFPAGLKTVGGFSYCTKLKDLILPEGLEVILPFAFCRCESICSIRIPASVKSINGNSFAGCNISKYEVDENNPYFSSVDGVIYSKDLHTLIAFPSAYPNKVYNIPKGTRAIASNAFYLSKIWHVEIPKSVIEIAPDAFEHRLG
ncbi:MAG: leucine-rich repeat domain-containing protein [Bacteroidales bacterium]|nr:leucine-rich repeat domain-containing protein [Bacteroidales bacterium]